MFLVVFWSDLLGFEWAFFLGARLGAPEKSGAKKKNYPSLTNQKNVLQKKNIEPLNCIY